MCGPERIDRCVIGGAKGREIRDVPRFLGESDRVGRRIGDPDQDVAVLDGHGLGRKELAAEPRGERFENLDGRPALATRRRLAGKFIHLGAPDSVAEPLHDA